MSLFYKLGASMGFVVVISNYLVQFPINHFGLSEVLTYGAFTYPITFLITDLANRAYGKTVARKIVYIGFFIGVCLTLLISTNFSDFISVRINIWYIAPLISSIFGSIVDTFLFFSISFYGTDIPWITLAFGDLSVKLFIALSMLIPFRLLLSSIKDFSEIRR